MDGVGHIRLGDPVILSRTGTRDRDLDLDQELDRDLDPGTGDPAYSLLWGGECRVDPGCKLGEWGGGIIIVFFSCFFLSFVISRKKIFVTFFFSLPTHNVLEK